MKKKMMFTLAGLMLAAIILLTGKPMTVQAVSADYTYRHIDLSAYTSENRAQVGTHYVWLTQNNTTDKTVLHSSVSTTGSGRTAATIDGTTICDFVTNGNIVYYVTPAGNLYKLDLTAKTRTKVAELKATLKSRLKTNYVYISPCGAYGSVVYLEVRNNDNFDTYIYAYYTKTGSLKRCVSDVSSIQGSANRTIAYSLSYGHTVSGVYHFDSITYVYNMKTGTSTRLCQASGSCYYNNKLYVLNYSLTNCTYTLREYDPETLKYSKVRTFDTKDGSYSYLGVFCYNGAAYIMRIDNSDENGGAYKILRLNLTTGKYSSISEDAVQALTTQLDPGCIFGF